MEVPLPLSLLLLCAAGTRSARTGGFPSPDEGLDEPGAARVKHDGLADRIRAPAFVSPGRAAQEAAALLDLETREEPALADIDFGCWSGQAFSDVPPDALAAWLGNPVDGTPGGESMAAVRTRAGRWLDGMTDADGPHLAITHATVIRALLSHALEIPLPSTLAIDIAPLSTTRLSFNRRWRLQSLG